MQHIHFQRKLDLCKLLAKFSKHFDMHLQPKIEYTSKWIEKESFDKTFSNTNYDSLKWLQCIFHENNQNLHSHASCSVY